MRPGELRTGDSVSRRPEPCTGSRAAHQAIRSVSVSTGVLVEPRTDIFGDADGTRQCQLAPVRSHRDRFRAIQMQVGFQTARHWRRGARPLPRPTSVQPLWPGQCSSRSNASRDAPTPGGHWACHPLKGISASTSKFEARREHARMRHARKFGCPWANVLLDEI